MGKTHRACHHCHARKVRCDAIGKGPPCTNCRVDAAQCVVIRRPKKTLGIMHEARHGNPLDQRQPWMLGREDGREQSPYGFEAPVPQDGNGVEDPPPPSSREDLHPSSRIHSPHQASWKAPPELWDLGLDYSLSCMLYQILEPTSAVEGYSGPCFSPSSSSSSSSTPAIDGPHRKRRKRNEKISTTTEPRRPAEKQVCFDAEGLRVLSAVRLAPGEFSMLLETARTTGARSETSSSSDPSQDEADESVAQSGEERPHDTNEDESHWESDFYSLVNDPDDDDDDGPPSGHNDDWPFEEMAAAAGLGDESMSDAIMIPH